MTNITTSNRKILLWAGSVLLAFFACIWIVRAPHSNSNPSLSESVPQGEAVTVTGGGIFPGDGGDVKASEAESLNNTVPRGAKSLASDLLAGRIRLSDELMKSAKPTNIHGVYWLRENPDFKLWQLTAFLNKHEDGARPPGNDKDAALYIFGRIEARPMGFRSYGWEDKEYFYFSIGLPNDRGNLVRGLMIEKKTGADYTWGESRIKRFMEKEAARTKVNVNDTGQP